MLFFHYYLWIAPHCLLAIVCFDLLRRRRQRQLPFFLAYVVFELTQFLTSVVIYAQSPFPATTYKWVVLIFGNGINSLLVLAVIYELADNLIASRSSKRFLLRRFLSSSLAVLLLLAAIASGALSSGGLERVMSIFETIDFCSSLVEAGLLLTLFTASKALGVSWRNWIAGIALGFGVSACIDLASAAWRASFGKRALIAVDTLQMAAFHVCVVIWLIYAFLPENKPVPIGAGLEKSNIEKWNHELEKFVNER